MIGMTTEVFTEETTVEDYIVDKLRENGWEFREADELERESYSEPLLVLDLVRAIKRINPFDLTESDINQAVLELRHRSAGIQGNKEILRFLKYGVSLKLEKTRDVERIMFIDYKNLENNEFIVSRQVRFEGPSRSRRADIVLYVNGIPLVLIECKNPTDPTVSWREACKQIKEYERDIPELFKYVQFSIAAEMETRYFPNISWDEAYHTQVWRKKGFDELEANLEMLSKETLLDLIRNFIFTREERGRASKVIARYMQYNATNKIFGRVINNLLRKDKKNSGLVWHWQGSGKTLTMIFSANKLYREPLLENPTIFFVLDRLDLQDQIFKEFSSLDLGVRPEVITSINQLKEVLLHDEGRGKRGIFIVLIQKFKEKLNELEPLKKEESIISRKNVIVFVDEGHRTQYGTLASQMRNILKDAFFFAFTGTPIAKRGRDTYLVFSYPPEETYLDRYFITDSIKDGFTVPIVFQTHLGNKIHLEKKQLEEFLEQELEEIPEESRDDVNRKIAKRLNTVKVLMRNKRRIQLIAEDIAKHFSENVDGKFKAMIVAVDREACVLYKRALDELLPSEYSEIVMTFNPKHDSPAIQNYLAELRNKYHQEYEEEIRKEIILKFKEEDYPKILIVTDMLLTGFDAPILQTMYLDKPLKGHRLLQAIARTNRPYKDVKEAGLIVDYVGIFKEFEKAIAQYSKEDVKEVANNIKKVSEEFEDLIKRLNDLFTGMDRASTSRETLMRVLRLLAEDSAKSKEFMKGYKELRKKFELLGPNELKIKYKKDFEWLTKIYYAYNRFVKRIDPDKAEGYTRKYFKKTLEYIHKTIDLDEIKNEFPILVLDENYMKRLEETHSDVESKISDMEFTLRKYVLVDETRTPIQESIAEKVERILRLWKEHKLSNLQAYKNLKKLVGAFNKIKKRQEELGLSDAEYYTFLILENRLKTTKTDKLISDTKELITEIKPKMFKGWSLQKSVYLT